MRDAARKLLATLALASLATLMGCASTPLTPVMPLPDKEPFERALVAYVQGESDRAQDEIQKALEAMPDDARALSLRAAVTAEAASKRLPPFSDEAGEVGASPATPDALLARVKARNLRLRAAVYEVIEARARLREARVSMSPELSLMTRFYPLGMLAALTQSVYGGLAERRALISNAESRLLSALANYAITRRTVLAEALQNYQQLQEAEAQTLAMGEELAVADSYRLQAKELLRSGTLLRTRVFEAQAEIAAAKADEESISQQAILARSRLNTLMQRPVDAPLALRAKGVVLAVPADPQSAAVKGRQELASARAELLQNQAAKARADTLLPDVNLRASWGKPNNKDERSIDKGFTVGAMFKVPLLYLPLRRARLDAAEALVAQAQLAEEDAFQTIALEVVAAQGEWLSARKAAEARERKAVEQEDWHKIGGLRSAAMVTDEEPDERLVREVRQHLRALRARRDALVANFAVDKAALRLALAAAVDPGAVNFEARAALSARNTSAGNGRGLWVWRPTFLGKPAETQAFLEWVSARGIDHLFVHLKASELGAGAAALKAFIEQAHAKGCVVHALGGDPSWVRPGKQSKAVDYLQQVLAFNDAVPEAARIDALHLDVEPQALSDWEDSDAQDDLLEGLVAVVTQVSRAAEGRIPLYADLPVWLAKRDSVEPPVLPKLARALNGVVFMAYGADRERLSEQLRKAGRQLAPTGRPWWIGLSAAPGDRCATETPEDFDAFTRQIAGEFADGNPLLGVAIHDLERYQAFILGKVPGTGKCSAPKASSPPSATD